MKTLLLTFKCQKFLPLICSLSFNIASAYFQLRNLTITLLSWPLLFLERGSRWQPSISLAFTSIPDSLQILMPVFSKSSLQMLFGMPDNSTLFLWLYCSPFAWFFSKFIILSSNLEFTFFVITSSLVSFLFSNEIWCITSVSLYIWSDSLCKFLQILPYQSCPTKALSDLLEDTWRSKKMGSASKKVFVQNKPAWKWLMSIPMHHGRCIESCSGEWLNCALEVLQENNIYLPYFSTAVLILSWNRQHWLTALLVAISMQ